MDFASVLRVMFLIITGLCSLVTVASLVIALLLDEPGRARALHLGGAGCSFLAAVGAALTAQALSAGSGKPDLVVLGLVMLVLVALFVLVYCVRLLDQRAERG